MRLANDIIAIIPARGGSKRIPRKNLMPLNGEPLIARTIRHAKDAEGVKTVYVSTDDPEIAAVARQFGAEVIDRPPALAGDAEASESALLHTLDWRLQNGLADPDLVVFLQCTCPIRKSDDIRRAVQELMVQDADSLFSGCREVPFLWRVGKDGLQSSTYDYRNRKRTQDWDVHYRENGSIYVFRPWVLRLKKNRLGGKIAVHEMDVWSSFDIDSLEEFRLVSFIANEVDRGAIYHEV